MDLYIIYLDDEMIVSKESFGSWHQIQERYDDYIASLGPWDADAVIDYLALEYTDLHPSAREQVNALLASTSPTAKVCFV
jgi:hypothetical protein